MDPWRCFHGALLFTLSQGAAEEFLPGEKEWMEWMEWMENCVAIFRKWKRFKNGFNIFGKCDRKTVGLQRCHVGFPNVLDDIPMFIGSSWFFASISSEFPDLSNFLIKSDWVRSAMNRMIPGYNWMVLFWGFCPKQIGQWYLHHIVPTISTILSWIGWELGIFTTT